MKIIALQLIILVLLSMVLVTTPMSLENENSLENEISLENQKEPKKTEFETKMNLEKEKLLHPIKGKALRLMNANTEGHVIKHAYFYWKDKNFASSSPLLSRFDKKVVEITNGKLIIYSEMLEGAYTDVSQKGPKLPPNQKIINSSNYLMTIRYELIDLPCNDNLYLCSLEELRTEWQKKMRGVDFTIPPEIIKGNFNEKNVGKNCIALTLGPFSSLYEIGIMCFESYETYVYYSNLISTRVFEFQNSQKGIYDGNILFVNEVSHLLYIQLLTL